MSHREKMSRQQQLLEYTHRMAALVQQELSSLLVVPRGESTAWHAAHSHHWLETLVSSFATYKLLGKGYFLHTIG